MKARYMLLWLLAAPLAIIAAGVLLVMTTLGLMADTEQEEVN